MADGEKERKLAGNDAIDTSVTVTGERGRPPADLVEALGDTTYTEDKRYRADALRSALVAEEV